MKKNNILYVCIHIAMATLFTTITFGQDTIRCQQNDSLGKEIIQMVEKDQHMRKSGNWDTSVDKKNTQRMKEIIDEYGWPTKSMVGWHAANKAWLLVQHADHDVEFQKKCLKLMKEAVEKKEANKKILPILQIGLELTLINLNFLERSFA
ncbi:hypothetical protein COB64_04490 [Candidatus Wolfebacteria bacterium]|nr:MAG: hypothetical protein COB64_04490 [Candidatus Wolfebacteria bacterium]